jgi:uncharacterized protein YbjT (DUF2867 family)
MFVENPILAWFPLKQLFSAGELRLPFGKHKIAPIAAYDVAEICSKILIDPSTHVSNTYELTGPEAKDTQGFAEDYAATLGRPVTYVPQELEPWIETYINGALASRVPHTAEHLRTITRLAASGRYEVVTGELEHLLGRPPKSFRWALERSPRLLDARDKA